MDATKPLVICDHAGRPIGVARENRKGYTKSLENGRLWAVHDETDRVLPLYEDRTARIEERDGFYVATLGPAAGDGADAPGGAPSPAPVGAQSGGDSGIGPVLERLAAVIAERHATLPEGSYTTHLFQSGAEKIRKKTGEEAIELVLASERRTIVSEAADLVYHLLVLLESERIPLSEIADELSAR